MDLGNMMGALLSISAIFVGAASKESLLPFV